MKTGQATAQALAFHTSRRVEELARELSDAISNPGVSPAAAAQAVAGLEALRRMVDNVRGVYQDNRFALAKRGEHTPAALARLLPGWNEGILEAERALRAASPAGFQRYAVKTLGNSGGMGIWSWNPNLWGKTQEEALAYEQAAAAAALQAEQLEAARKVEEAKGNAAASSIDPSLASTFSQSAQSALKATTSAYNLLLIGGVVALGIWGYSEYKDAKKSKARR